MQSVFKIEGVLTGDSRVIALEARDAADRRVRIELPAEEAGAVTVGSVLVVQWWSAELPGEASSLGTTARMGAAPAEGAAGESSAATTDVTSDATSDATASARADAEFRRLMGLR